MALNKTAEADLPVCDLQKELENVKPLLLLIVDRVVVFNVVANRFVVLSYNQELTTVSSAIASILSLSSYFFLSRFRS